MPRLGIIVALVSAGVAHGQVPASNDTSSEFDFNTGMGTGALGGPAATNAGQGNTAVGFGTLKNNSGNGNTASGVEALLFNTTGSNNTASGEDALLNNATGINNTATGNAALDSNTSGSNNTASGYFALLSNATGNYNTADGVSALSQNAGGSFNTAGGYQALYNNTVNYNTGFGYAALYANTTGLSNTTVGVQALLDNVTGDQNTATGYLALVSSTGSGNTGFGYEALRSVWSGSSNIALGSLAGYNLTTGGNNIDIGNEGDAGEAGVIRIGTSGTQTAAFIAGIEGSTVTGKEVFVTTSGQLGVKASAERYKTAIEPMDVRTEKLNQLRPVSFHLESEPQGDIQYGLIAEEVAKVYPELVTHDEKGRIDGVRYDELAPMLLDEVQHQAAKIASLEQKVAEVDDLKKQLSTVIQQLKARENLAAQR
jgi:hypothetical protein